MKKTPTTQQNIPIAGIQDGIIILKNGQYRITMEVSAVNFALKSEQEQNSLIFQYQSFLNSLHFPIEVIIRSKRLDLSPYLSKINKIADQQNNELLQVMTKDYVDFVSQLISIANIMKKTFYVVVGYQPLVQSGGFIDKIFHRDESGPVRISEDQFDRFSKELHQRARSIASKFGSMGLHCRQLSTQEILELFYGIYNPEVASKERLTEAESLSSTYVTTSPQKSQVSTEDMSPVDNSAQVIDQQRKKQQRENQETAKTAERQMRQSESPKKEDHKKEAKEALANTPPPDQQTTEEKVVKDPKLNKDYGW